MKSRILSFLGIGAIAFAVACNSAEDESGNADSAAAATDASVATTDGSAAGSVQTAADGRRYIIRQRSSGSTSSTSSTSGSTGSEYDTVWLYMGTQDRYYTLGVGGRDTLYYDSDEWKSWWSNPETDNELKSKSGDTKVKIDDDGSWKVKDGDSKTKMNEDGKVKTKPKGEKS